jgi:hypothetical protein
MASKQDELEPRIGMLRQWLNEDRIKDANRFVTNEDIHLWLDSGLEAYTNKQIAETVQLNRIELAKDIKHRHWANDNLRDVYLDAVISVAKEELATLRKEAE